MSKDPAQFWKLLMHNNRDLTALSRDKSGSIQAASPFRHTAEVSLFGAIRATGTARTEHRGGRPEFPVTARKTCTTGSMKPLHFHTTLCRKISVTGRSLKDRRSSSIRTPANMSCGSTSSKEVIISPAPELPSVTSRRARLSSFIICVSVCFC